MSIEQPTGPGRETEASTQIRTTLVRNLIERAWTLGNAGESVRAQAAIEWACASGPDEASKCELLDLGAQTVSAGGVRTREAYAIFLAANRRRERSKCPRDPQFKHAIEAWGGRLGRALDAGPS